MHSPLLSPQLTPPPAHSEGWMEELGTREAAGRTKWGAGGASSAPPAALSAVCKHSLGSSSSRREQCRCVDQRRQRTSCTASCTVCPTCRSSSARSCLKASCTAWLMFSISCSKASCTICAGRGRREGKA